MRKILNGSIGLLLTCAALVAGAQGYPTKPVHMVVPYPAGGYYDLLARVIGAKLGETWGQPVVVENRVGANGMVGTDFVIDRIRENLLFLSVPFDALAPLMLAGILLGVGAVIGAVGSGIGLRRFLDV